MLEAAYDIIVTGLPVFFHSPTRKLVILRSSFVALGVINEMNNVIDFFIGFLRKNLLSLLKIISERNNDAIRTELASRQWFRIVAPLEVSVSL